MVKNQVWDHQKGRYVAPTKKHQSMWVSYVVQPTQSFRITMAPSFPLKNPTDPVATHSS